MKRILIAFFCLIAQIGYSQFLPVPSPKYQHVGAQKVDTFIIINPQDTSDVPASKYPGAVMFMQAVGDTSHYFSNGIYWVRMGAKNIRALDSLRYDPTTATFYTRYTTGGELAVATGLVDSLSGNTLQRVSERGNSTAINIHANGGVDVTSGNLMLGAGATTSRVITSRFVDLYGQSTGVVNGALISFFKSNGTRTGAIGDGSSWDDNMYINASNNSDIRFAASSGQSSTDPYSIPMTVTGYTNGSKVLIGDTATNNYVLPENVFSVRGGMQVFNTLNKSATIDFWDGRATKERGAVGMMGQPEMNLSMNMYYYDRVHKYYDSTKNAIWLALSNTAGAFAIQYAPSGYGSTGDIWSRSGNRILFRVDTVKSDFYSATGTFGFDIHRAKSANNQGLSIDVGGGTTKINSYDSTNVVFAGLQFISTKGSTGKILAHFDGTTGNMSVGTSTSPTATIDVNGATGYNQLRLRNSYTPTSTADANGNTGDVSWDAAYFYIKTAAGWKRSALTTF